MRNSTASRFRAFGLAAAVGLGVAPLPAAAQSLTGYVTDTAGAPILGARATITGQGDADTDEKGIFRLANLTAGLYSLTVRRLGFIPLEVSVQLSPGVAAEVRVRLKAVAATLPPVVVRPDRMRYTGRLAGYYKRLEHQSGGYFITREQIDRENPSTTGQLLQRVPAIQMVRGRGGITGIRMRGRRCWPLVWIDGMPMPAGEVDIDAFVPTSIQGIELYLGATTAPLAFVLNEYRSSCGTILIWSRGPDTDPVRAPRARGADLENLVAKLAVFTPQQVDRRARLDSTQALDLHFPPSLFASRTRGLVVAEFVVDTLGRVEQNTVGVVSSTAPLFADAVRVALATASFVPALKDGRPVRQLVQQPFQFDIAASIGGRDGGSNPGELRD